LECFETLSIYSRLSSKETEVLESKDHDSHMRERETETEAETEREREKEGEHIHGISKSRNHLSKT